jgi:hypothetical protein
MKCHGDFIHLMGISCGFHGDMIDQTYFLAKNPARKWSSKHVLRFNVGFWRRARRKLKEFFSWNVLKPLKVSDPARFSCKMTILKLEDCDFKFPCPSCESLSNSGTQKLIQKNAWVKIINPNDISYTICITCSHPYNLLSILISLNSIDIVK